MDSVTRSFCRRRFLQSLALGAGALAARGAFAARGTFAEELTRTPRQTEGPFYPDRLPLDTDNDLLIVNDSITPAVGEITHLTGRVLGPTGEPIRNAVIEIWQVDGKGIYLHSGSPQHEKRDGNFQGFGRFLTGSKGEYYFRTIKPIPYTAGIQRAPHIHFIIKKGEKRMLTTQCYIKGHPMNEQDAIFRGIRDARARESVLVEFRPMEDSTAGELAAKFDLVIGHTPEDPEENRPRGGPDRKRSQRV